MQIREMEAQDISALAEIEKKIFSQPWSAQAFADALSDPNALFLVAAIEPDDQPCAYVGMYIAADEGEITNVATDPVFRRKGFAEALMARIKEIGLQKGLPGIYERETCLQVNCLHSSPSRVLELAFLLF